MVDWIGLAVPIAGSIAGSFLAVRLAVARLEVNVAHIDTLIQAHDTTLDAVVARLAPLEKDVERMKADIGTHDTGMRGDVRAHGTLITAHEFRLHALDKQPIREI